MRLESRSASVRNADRHRSEYAYYTPEAPSTKQNDGRFIEYLDPEHEPRFRFCDPELYDELRTVVREGRRALPAIEKSSSILPEATVYFRWPVPRGFEARRDWAKKSLSELGRQDVVFLDPDNGMWTSKTKDGLKRSSDKYVLPDELSAFLEGGTRSVIVYQHISRQGSAEAQLERRAAEIRDMGGKRVFWVWWRAYSPRAYFIIPARKHSSLLSPKGLAKGLVQWRLGAKEYFTHDADPVSHY